MGSAAKVFVLTAGTAVAAGIGHALAWGLGWGGTPLPVVAAALLCLSSALATFLLAEAVFRKVPQFGPVAVLVGTGLRMTVAVVGVFLFADVMERHGTPRDRFAGWVTYLYIVTLALECGLLMGTAARPGSNTGGQP